MLHLTQIRELNLLRATAPGRPAYLSAASGLVCINEYLYVVADDELQLAVFKLNEAAPGELLRLFPGELPDKPKKRKKLKPDLEVLTRLPAFHGYPHGALLALGSGSMTPRCRGVLLALDGRGAVQGAPRIVDASALFASLMQHVDPLNLEGAWVTADQLCLLQRGNKSGAVNAVIRLPLANILSALAQGDVLPALVPKSTRTLVLGDIEGVPLCFSDACVLPDGHWLFTAIAEDVDNAIADGEFLGAAIGMMDANDQLLWIKRVTPPYKIEGIEVRQTNAGLQLLLVTDADDLAIPSCLLSTEL